MHITASGNFIRVDCVRAQGSSCYAFLHTIFLGVVPLALALAVFISHNAKEADELAQCIVVGAQSIFAVPSFTDTVASHSKVAISVPIISPVGSLSRSSRIGVAWLKSRLPTLLMLCLQCHRKLDMHQSATLELNAHTVVYLP